MKQVSGKQFCKLLQRRGWALARVRGSHFTYKKAGCKPLTVPVHKNIPLKIGMLKSLMKDAGIVEADL